MFEAVTDYVLRLVENGEVYVALLPIYAALLIGERLAHWFTTDRRWDNRDAAANITITVGMLVVDVVLGAIVPLALMTLLYEHARIFSLGWGPWGWLAAFLLWDLTWYIDHRIGHRTGLFWAMHHVHHSSEEFNMTVASRGFVFDNTFLTRPLFYLLPILGVAPLQFLTVKLITSVWGIAQHTRLVGRLGWLEYVFATPSNHRVHHGSDPKYLDKNYGEILIIWDRLFGTYQREEEAPTYGVVEPIETYNVLKIETAGIRALLGKLRTAGNIGNQLRCLILPPGWKPPAEGAG